MGFCFSKYDSTDGSESQGEFSGGNIHVITSNDVWEQKLEEAKKDNKIVSKNMPQGAIALLITYHHKSETCILHLMKVIANFSASWCDPCKMIAPYYRELSEKHLSLMFLTIDVDELTEFSSQWDIKATPTFFFLKDGQEVDKLVGANRIELEKKIASAVTSIAPG